MNNKIIGIGLILVGIFFIFSTYTVQDTIDQFYMEQMMNFEGDTCYLEDGTCIHENPVKGLMIAMYIVAASISLFGIYLLTFSKHQEQLLTKLHETSNNIKEIKEQDSQEKAFESFLKGFSEDERKILTNVKKQPGIWQSTLRIKTGLSKATLSIILTDLEKKGHISKVKKGKTNEIHLKD